MKEEDAGETVPTHPEPGYFRGTNGGDSEPKLAGSDRAYSLPLLYVHQEEWQHRLMEMYGNAISLIDATYKTTQYDLALFFIAVRTNVGYM